MADLVEHAVERLRALPPEDRESVAFAVLQTIDEQQHPYELTPEEEADIKESMAQAERGEFASDEEVRAIWAKHGL